MDHQYMYVVSVEKSNLPDKQKDPRISGGWQDMSNSPLQAKRFAELSPEISTHLAKFASGIYEWCVKGLIDIANPDDVGKVRMILIVLDQTPWYDFFDELFNDFDPDTVCKMIGISCDHRQKEDETIDFDYSVAEIKDFMDAHAYFETVTWCIVISEESFNEYTKSGNRFYFCANGNWKDVPSIPGYGFPHDKYGYSLIAVEVTPDNKIASVTSRWNTDMINSKSPVSLTDLRKVLGEANFTKLFHQNNGT